MKQIALVEPQLDGNEARYLQECVASNYVSSVGPFVSRFEDEFARWVGAPYAVACSSGTAALHLALRVAGVGPGDTVAVSDFTFIATVNAIAYVGAQPLLVDSEPLSWNLDSDRLLDHVRQLAARGSPLPSAVLPVHILGSPADMEPLLEIRERFEIPIIEDAAEALGATVDVENDQPVGTIGELGCFSFNGNKLMTTGGGGMVVTNDRAAAERVRHLSTQARLEGREYVHDDIGHNYRLTNVAAALGVAQLERLNQFLSRKRAIAERYDAELAGLGLTRPVIHHGRSSCWLYSVLLPQDGPDKDEVLDALARQGILARPVWPPVHRQVPYRGTALVGSGERSDEIHRRGVSLPSSVGLSADEQERVIRSLRQALEELPSA